MSNSDNSYKAKDFLSLRGMCSDDFEQLIHVAHYLKRRWRKGVHEHSLDGQQLAMVFEKPSLRTRVSFEVGMSQLGGRAMYLSGEEVGIGKRETVEDVARVLSRYVDGIMIRTFAHEVVEGLAAAASVPVINGLSDAYHPCQALADMLTIDEHFSTMRGLKVVFIGDANNVARSLAWACHLVGSTFVLACPQDYAFAAADREDFAEAWGSSISQVHDPRTAVEGAHVLYTDVWTSMGQEEERDRRLQAFQGYQINATMLEWADPSCKIMHCLPAHRGEEITADALEGASSIVFDQAENRLHAQKAVMRVLMGGDRERLFAAVAADMQRPVNA
ncbi:MAG: ornithine carbamoyltransferase [Planctomycetota bacterium]|nr:MAG: ornithine carbamoyltransferase [Planctomycetota bacterium]